MDQVRCIPLDGISTSLDHFSGDLTLYFKQKSLYLRTLKKWPTEIYWFSQSSDIAKPHVFYLESLNNNDILYSEPDDDSDDFEDEVEEYEKPVLINEDKNNMKAVDKFKRDDGKVFSLFLFSFEVSFHNFSCWLGKFLYRLSIKKNFGAWPHIF